ncbi:MAG: ChaN family lipoprotein [Tenuifilaceae bacterium]|jgi:uncharacterized iron-regulated protein|nr:ChaN family lipoprotein [Bacteroidota bacterium]MZP83243.1 iron-regulated protein [Bacteroidales bacterium]NLH57766.1 ChaN family lipoprotein [Rikenellaceae bacterium]OQC61259.1 MAG: hypothetical protein BWX49_02344 [Bacteroidetes bacterium ADurb.Bin008]HOF92055.1 ChaN family lipoprotein [Tenuifilaceae bacterium]
MKKITFILIVCSIFFVTNAQQLDAYRIYTANGEEITYGAMKNNLMAKDVVLFGELHDNPIAHWLQLELAASMFETKGKSLTLGAEMFEADNQLIINEYFWDYINQNRFEAEARLWPNYKTDYKPIIEFAKENGINFIATNIPRRYAAMVSGGGFEALEKLTDEAKSYIAPLPIEYDPELSVYKAMVTMMGMPAKGHVDNQNLPKAQAIKDATMAWNISKNLSENGTFLHFHGTYHSDNYEGIVWYLKRYRPKVNVGTIATVLQDNIEQLDEENHGKADYIIVVPHRMTRTY